MNKLAKNTLFLSFCTLLNKGLLFIMLPFFTRWLSVEDFGTFDLYTTYVALLIPIISMATSNAVFRLAVDESVEKKKELFTNGLILNIVNYVFIIILLFSIKNLIHLACFEAFALLLFGEILDNYLQGYLRALKQLTLYGICKTISVVVTAISVTFFLLVFKMGLSGIILGYAIGYIASSIIIIIHTRFFKWIDISLVSKKCFFELINYSWALIPNDISWWIINVSDRQIISSFLGAGFNGLYAVSYKIPNLCSSVFGVFSISWQESATETVDAEQRDQYFQSVYKSTFNLLISISIMILSFNFVFFDYIFDIRYTTARLYVPILVVSVVFSTISLFYGGIQIALKRPKQNGFSTVIGAVINVSVHLLLIRSLGLYAAAISTLVSSIAVTSIRRFQIRNEFSHSITIKEILLCFCLLLYCVLSVMDLPLIINIAVILFGMAVSVTYNKNIIVVMYKKIMNKLVSNNNNQYKDYND